MLFALPNAFPTDANLVVFKNLLPFHPFLLDTYIYSNNTLPHDHFPQRSIALTYNIQAI